MKAAIINAAIGGHYARGQKRLLTSIQQHRGVEFHGYEDWPSDEYDRNNRYNIKAACMEHANASAVSANVLIWMDCTAIVVRPIHTLIDSIKERGYYLSSSGYSAAQTCTDVQLEAAGFTRDQAMTIPDTATGCIGIDLTDVRARAFMEEWIDWAKRGLFAGSRTHNPKDSIDPRFLFGRQDQSAATLLAFKYGMDLDPMGELTCYWPPSPTAVMAYKGIQ